MYSLKFFVKEQWNKNNNPIRVHDKSVRKGPVIKKRGKQTIKILFFNLINGLLLLNMICFIIYQEHITILYVEIRVKNINQC